MEIAIVTNAVDREFHLLLFHKEYEKAVDLLERAPVNLEALCPMGRSGMFFPHALPVICTLTPDLRRYSARVQNFAAEEGRIRNLLDVFRRKAYALFKDPERFLYDSHDDIDSTKVQVASDNLVSANAILTLLGETHETAEMLLALGLTREIVASSVGAPGIGLLVERPDRVADVMEPYWKQAERETLTETARDCVSTRPATRGRTL